MGTKTKTKASKSSTKRTQPLRPIPGGRAGAPSKARDQAEERAAAKARPPARKIGERRETITELLSPSQVDAEGRAAMSKLREIERHEEEFAKLRAKHRMQMGELKTQLKHHVTASTSAKRDVEIVIEEWLTENNEVVRIRADTRQQIGNRVATRDDLQEDLPLERTPPNSDEPDPEDDDPSDDELAADDPELAAGVAALEAKHGDPEDAFGEGE